MSAQHRLAAWFVALTLFLGQSAAFAHALTHIGHHDPGHAPDIACELCVGQASLSGGLSAAPLSGLPPPATRAPRVVQVADLPQTRSLTPSARAPPRHPA